MTAAFTNGDLVIFLTVGTLALAFTIVLVGLVVAVVVACCERSANHLADFAHTTP